MYFFYIKITILIYIFYKYLDNHLKKYNNYQFLDHPFIQIKNYKHT